jgi:hypothetical protein
MVERRRDETLYRIYNRAEDYAFVMAANYYFWDLRMEDTPYYLGGFSWVHE